MAPFTYFTIMSKSCTWLLLITVVCLAGCGRKVAPLPTTYPVHGKVTYKNGSPVGGGVVQFQSQADLSVTTAGAINPDGTYSLGTTRDGLRSDGAVAGPNCVIVAPREPGSMVQSAMRSPTIRPTPFNVEPRDNELDLSID